MAEGHELPSGICGHEKWYRGILFYFLVVIMFLVSVLRQGILTSCALTSSSRRMIFSNIVT